MLQNLGRMYDAKISFWILLKGRSFLPTNFSGIAIKINSFFRILPTDTDLSLLMSRHILPSPYLP